jgi:hypothetical protein
LTFTDLISCEQIRGQTRPKAPFHFSNKNEIDMGYQIKKVSLSRVVPDEVNKPCYDFSHMDELFTNPANIR